jgi:uncharacterized PurR-regulated membrane protein YhhQ (DUF165 family)
VTRAAFALVTVYLAAIVAANWSVTHWGPRAAVYNAFVLIGLDLVTRDRLHDLWREHLAVKMAALIAAGLLSYFAFGADGRIAAASCAAFAVAATLDAIVYHLARRQPWLERSNLSNVFGAAADSVVFQTVAFGWAFPLIFAQFTAKVAGGLVWSLLLRSRR